VSAPQAEDAARDDFAPLREPGLSTACEKCGNPPEAYTEQVCGICYDCAPEAYAELQKAVSRLLHEHEALTTEVARLVDLLNFHGFDAGEQP
jgi:hypothetical protein